MRTTQEEYTVDELAESWFARNTGKWSASTKGGYRNLIYQYIIPDISKMKLKKLKPPHLRAFYDKLAVSGRSSRSIWCVHLLLRRILDNACRERFIDRNLADICEVQTEERKPTVHLMARM